MQLPATHLVSRVIAVLGVCATAVLSFAAPLHADTVYTDRNAFLSHVAPGYYLETFAGVGVQLYSDPLSFSNNGFAYTASSAPDGLYPGAPNGNVDLSTDSALLPITLTFTGKPVTAVGGYLFGNDIAGNYLAGNITVRLDDGTEIPIPNATLSSWFGVITAHPIQSLIIFSDDFIFGDDVLPVDVWPATDDFITGTAVPEPTSATLCIAAALAFAVIRIGHHQMRM